MSLGLRASKLSQGFPSVVVSCFVKELKEVLPKKKKKALQHTGILQLSVLQWASAGQAIMAPTEALKTYHVNELPQAREFRAMD